MTAHATEPVPTPRYRKIVEAASNTASDQGHQHVGAEHLFLAIIGDPLAVPTQVLAKIADVEQVQTGAARKCSNRGAHDRPHLTDARLQPA